MVFGLFNIYVYVALACTVLVSADTACEDTSCLLSHAESGAALMQQKQTLATKSAHVVLHEMHAPVETDRKDEQHEPMMPELDQEGTPNAFLAEHSGISQLASKAGVRGFRKTPPCSALLSESVGAKPRRGEPPVGKSSSIDEDGYTKVANLEDDVEMEAFIRRVIDRYDCKVEDESGLMGIVPWFSGTTMKQSLVQLERVLLFAVLADGKPWITFKNSGGITGKNAPLDLNGYLEVAALRKDDEMKDFVRNLAESMGIKVLDEGGFEGMIKYYSGSSTFQSFERLQSELESAKAAPHSWAALK